MDRSDIMMVLAAKLKDSQYMLQALSVYEKTYDRSPTKLQLMDLTNALYQKALDAGMVTNENKKKLISSRHVLDVFAAKLEGGGLVDVEEVGRVRLYRLSKLGKELISFVKERNIDLSEMR